VVKISQALSGAIVQDNLIGTLLRAALEETGAQRGLLILSRSGEPRIAAEAIRRHETIVVRLRDEVVTESLLPESVVYYVQDTRESVVIDDAATRARFVADPYVSQHKVASILCLPLLNQAKLVGVLLLEDHLASGVFTPARITVLKLMSSLAASALENSRLYGDLQEREAKIRRLVEADILGIYIVDIGGPILEANDAYLRMLGCERADLVSGRLRWTDLTPPEWRTADAQRVERVKRIGRLQPFEKEFFRKDGTRVPVLVGVARFKEPRNQAIVFAHDMSKQKRAETLTLQARMIEDTRIARKLHDALLQNFQAMMFRFQAARNLMMRHPDEALRSLNDAINEGEKALDESRDAIQDLGSEREGGSRGIVANETARDNLRSKKLES
jgi:PAS domain S-box-containing protein